LAEKGFFYIKYVTICGKEDCWAEKKKKGEFED